MTNQIETTPRTDNAKRLHMLRERHSASRTQPECDYCFLVGEIDFRDAALRESRAEIERIKENA